MSKSKRIFKGASAEQMAGRPESHTSPEEEAKMRIDKTIHTSDGIHVKSTINMPVGALKTLQALEGVVPAATVSTKTGNRKKDPKKDADYKKYEYKCSDMLEIPGTIPKNRRNEVIINGHKIQIGDSPFELLLCLVVAAKKSKGGWIKMTTDAGKYQRYSNLRRNLEGSLLEKDSQKFIENDGAKRYRISTHPDFITYDKEKLLQYSSFTIKDLVKQLPKMGSNNRKKR